MLLEQKLVNSGMITCWLALHCYIQLTAQCLKDKKSSFFWGWHFLESSSHTQGHAKSISVTWNKLKHL